MREKGSNTLSRLRSGGCLLALASLPVLAYASDYRGLVKFHGLPVPGATVTVTAGGKKLVAVTDMQGFYSFEGLTDGALHVDVQMTGFAAFGKQLTLAPDTPLDTCELSLLTLDQARAELKPVPSAPITQVQVRSEAKVTGKAAKPQKDAGNTAAPAHVPEETAQKATDGLLINGSVNNAATSQYSLAPRFGNTASGKSLYTFMLHVQAADSALNANSYSVAGAQTPKPQTSDLTGGFAVQGPFKIPGLVRNGPNVFLIYERTQNSDAVTTPGRVPTLAERSGDLSGETDANGNPITIYNPVTGQPYANNQVPVSAIAANLLNTTPYSLYPLPNITGNPRYNYQAPLVTETHSDTWNAFAYKTVGRKNEVHGGFSSLSTRSSNTTLLGFVDDTRSLGLTGNVEEQHTFNMHLRGSVRYQYSRQATRMIPYWQNRANVSGNAGISGDVANGGTDQEAVNWGPPTLAFSGGMSTLTDVQSSFIRNQSNALSATGRWNAWTHNVSVGGEFRRQEFNYLRQANPRGTFTFTGAATANHASGTSSSSGSTGNDFADFLIDKPDASAITVGNADKYLRQNVVNLFANDDWRVTPQLTVNAGVRWEYGSPVTEVKDRLVNLDVAPGFAAVGPVLPSAPKGPVTGQVYTDSLMNPDRTAIEPRIGISWRPLPASSLVVSGGFGLYYNTSVYEGIALRMAEQAPLSRSRTLENSAACSLTLEQGFPNSCAITTPENFGVDQNFRVGSLYTWNLKVQRDLPGSLQMVLMYLGNKGVHGMQEFLPNTYAPGGTDPCPSCQRGFLYLASGGNSTRESGQIQLRRRLKSGLTASLLYTYSKSLDDDSVFGGQGAASLISNATIAQDWRNLRAERGLSSFDQRHLLNFTAQYTTGMGMHGGTLLSGWRGRLYKEWTVQTQITAGSGLPETPVVATDLVAGYASSVRPNRTGAPIDGSGGLFLNPAAFATPALGQWGNARRNSIIGPGVFTLDAAMLRTFRLPDKMTLDLQVSAQNALNHVTYTSWVTNINSTQFGLPALANPMRKLQTSLRWRF